MNPRRPPELDMTLNGEFVAPRATPITSRILMWALIVAIIAGGISFAAFALWLALLVLPVALGAAVLAWAMVRYRVWRAQQMGRARQNVWRQ